MKISTLEKIHELLKKEVKTRNNELELTRKVYNERQDDLEAIKAIAAAAGDMSVAAAKQAVGVAQAVYDEARQQNYDADAALRDFEAQEF